MKKTKKHLIFYISDEQFAISIENILTIEKVEYDNDSWYDSRIKKVNSYPTYVEGVFSFKNKVIPVIEFEYFLTRQKMNRHNENKIIVIKGKEKNYGILVNDVYTITELESENFEKIYDDIPVFIASKDNDIFIVPDIDEMIKNTDIWNAFHEIQNIAKQKRQS